MKVMIPAIYKNFLDRISKDSRIYLVGGFVRDSIIGIKNLDIDIATNKNDLEKILKFAEKIGYPVNYDGLKFGVGIIYLNNEHKLDVAMFRSEFYNEDSRKPITFTENDIIEDLARRDFTINAVAIEYNTGNIINPFGGLEDILSRTLRCVGDPSERFSEDPLRMLRAIRFAAKYKMNITNTTIEAIRRNFYRLDIVSPERIREELLKGLKYNPKTYFKLLEETSLLYYIFEDYKDGKFIKHDNRGRHHGETIINHIEEILKDD